jgi:hypothetical protein
MSRDYVYPWEDMPQHTDKEFLEYVIARHNCASWYSADMPRLIGLALRGLNVSVPWWKFWAKV